MCFSTILLGIFDGFSADGDEVMDGLPDGSTDKSVNVQMEGSFPGYCIIRNFCTGILIGIFTMKMVTCHVDAMTDRQVM